MKIYGDMISGNCLKVKWTADFLGLPYEWIAVDVLKGQSRAPEFLAVNPWGQIPAVVLDDGRALSQSNAIILHLAEGSPLIPADAYDRARVYEWLFWEQYSHEPYVAVARFQVAFLGKAVAEIEPRLIERGDLALKRLDEALADSPFLVGKTLTLADVALVAYTRWAEEGGFTLARYPNVKSWIPRVEAALKIA
jgi:glutathione S-transferase